MANWREFIPAADWELYSTIGLGRPTGLGARPALLVIDVQFRTLGDKPLPLRESITSSYATSCGQNGWDALPVIAEIIASSRSTDVPVLYPCVPYRSASQAGQVARKAPGLLAADAHAHEFPEAIAPSAGDRTVPKTHASAFHGTPLMSYLVDLGIDTVLLTGCTTSGCVRATAVDASAHNLKTVVVEDGVYDRVTMSHCVSLFDIQAKYGEVMPAGAVLAYLGRLGHRDAATAA
jgi:nicotinamidase-related amidase